MHDIEAICTGLWSLRVEGRGSSCVKPVHPLQIRNACLALNLKSINSGSVELYLTYRPIGAQSSTTVLLATFFPNYVEQELLRLDFLAGSEYTFSVLGDNDIDLIGTFNVLQSNENEQEEHRESNPTENNIGAMDGNQLNDFEQDSDYEYDGSDEDEDEDGDDGQHENVAEVEQEGMDGHACDDD